MKLLNHEPTEEMCIAERDELLAVLRNLKTSLYTRARGWLEEDINEVLAKYEEEKE